ncbi:Poly(A)-specific ribonuclease PARN-like domain-containing protein [Blastocystis sp. ATCC 50177/Nand II]|uniref:Poly(A)-specific ribonuclease PARN-like domain-containing protein n=2 Tax=Blastocystis sp. subtype 1 (strain ATCC 50177 / NandII) TaxID=478820 RepID=A0A196SL89_BLAHN|nr:Poly(A)-specific ribonuclease PARN-like domain-containing protein [Blastocystis sp. ATCC 50177/Nand II]
MTECVEVVEVTDETFEQELPHIQKVIFDSAFAAFDMEFSGLEVKPCHKSVQVDTFDTRYSKTKESVESFFPFQFGLACFKYNEKEKRSRYDATIFNIYMSPYSHSSIDDAVAIRPHTIEFLKSCHFDFNKAFIHGVPSLRRSDEKRILDEIEKSYSDKTPRTQIEINKNQMKAISPAFDKINRMIDVIKNGPEEERQKLAKENGKYYIVLDAMNPFYRRLMYQEVEKQYKDLISLAKLDKDNKDMGGKSRRLRATCNLRDGDATIDTSDSDVKLLRVEEVTKMVGIRRVLELLSGKRLPLVGFEMLNDLMFSYHWCVDRLPETCRNFVTNVARDFPLIIDVQSLCREKSLGTFLPDGTSLEAIYKGTGCPEGLVVQTLAPEHVQAHDAGFDAYMTGVVMLRLGYRLGLGVADFRDLNAFYQKELPQESAEGAFRQVPCQFQRQMNAVNMYNVKYPMPMLDALWQTREEEMEAEYVQCVLLASGFVKEVKTADFASLARPFLEAEQKVAILWLDDNYCLLSFPTPAACTRLFEAWREAHEQAMSATQTETEERLTLQTVVLERFDAFERLCGMKVAKKEESSQKREHEESVVFENKRLRIVRKIARPESEKKWCSVM